MSEQPALLEMDEKLRNDPNGLYRKELQEELFQARQSLKIIMDKGLAADEFNACEQLQQSLDAAQDVVDTVWNKYNA